MKTRLMNCAFLVAFFTCFVPGILQPAHAERPAAPRLLPESTLAVGRVADAPQLADRFRETAMGRISQDPQMKPLVGQLYKSLQDAWKQIEDRVGLPLDQMLKIPQGEICVAFVGLPEQPPGVIAFLDVKGELAKAQTLLAKGEDFLRENGGSKSSEQIEQQEIALYNTRTGPIYLLERDGTLAFATSKELMQFVLRAWDGNVERTLADNEQYNAIMSRCAGAVDDPPQITWYFDPIETVRRLARGSFAATGLALFPALGLDGVRGVGGSIAYASGDYDAVTHMHLLLSNPRKGVVEALALKSGDTTPEAWVPPDAVTYSTIHWDLNQTFNVATKLYNNLTEEGALQQEVRNRITPALGVDFEKEILPLVDGRATLVQWVEKPVRINSITTFVGLRIKDQKNAKLVLDKVLQKYPDRVEKQQYGNVRYWSLRVPQRPMRENGPALRQPLPCFGIVDNYLLFTDSMLAFQEAVVTSTDPGRGLANSLDFKLMADKIKRQPGGDAPGAIQFNRAEEGLRFWYDLAASEDTKRRLSQQASGNQFFGALDQALKDNPLPPFSVISKYVAPGGGMLVNDEMGLHYTTFTLKRE